MKNIASTIHIIRIRGLIVFFILFASSYCQLNAQISQGGLPLSFNTSLKSSNIIPVEIMPALDVDALLEEDEFIDSQDGYPFRFSSNFKVNLSTENSGRWYEVDKGRIWQVRLKSVGAHSMHLIFSQYNLPPGATVYIYNAEKTHILGAFTDENNKAWGGLGVAPVVGDEIFVEYYEPKDASFSGMLSIGEIGHGYRDIFGINDNRFGLSEKCNKDIICSVADDWQIEKHAVCRIIYTNLSGNSYLCTGSLINNTNSDGIPYFLTANHCIPTINEAQTAIFYFNYESPSCNGPDGDISQTISGSELRATTNKLDFSLLEMSQSVPLDYEPYFAGWDATPDPPENSTGIHHPLGDVKKISFYNFPATTDDFIYEFDFDDSTHWYIENWSSGITQGGSSGSPLFNQNHHIVGDLTGGSIIANCTSADAYYAKFSDSWDKYSSNKEQLKYWLDPDTTNIQSLDGYSPTGLKIRNIRSVDKVFDIYPNPTSGYFTIQAKEDGLEIEQVELYDVLGKKVLERILAASKGSITIKTNSLSEGLYLVRVYTKKEILTSKVRIKH
ncbi:MAG: T9SS type A sorting domain-containing protein [Bacteroidales bacterium]|nr:T9SS type A sorting domain-containing protein [Bacteroidales bacterium]